MKIQMIVFDISSEKYEISHGILSDITTYAVSSIIASRVTANFICILFEIRDTEKDRAKYSIKKQLQISNRRIGHIGYQEIRCLAFDLLFEAKNHRYSLHINLWEFNKLRIFFKH